MGSTTPAWSSQFSLLYPLHDSPATGDVTHAEVAEVGRDQVVIILRHSAIAIDICWVVVSRHAVGIIADTLDEGTCVAEYRVAMQYFAIVDWPPYAICKS